MATPAFPSQSCPETYVLASWLFLRLLGIIYLTAFVSLAVQIKGLAGRDGVLPAADFLFSRSRWRIHRFYRVPTAGLAATIGRFWF